MHALHTINAQYANVPRKLCSRVRKQFQDAVAKAGVAVGRPKWLAALTESENAVRPILRLE